jgi:hypothetical protein
MSNVKVEISKDPKDCAGQQSKVESIEISLDDLRNLVGFVKQLANIGLDLASLKKLIEYAKKMRWI